MTKQSIQALAALVTAGLLIASSARAEGPVDCGNARPRQACVVWIDAKSQLVPGPVTVVSGTAVTIKVKNKNPLDSVKFTMDRAAATPPDNPLALLLSLATNGGLVGLQAIMRAPGVAADQMMAQTGLICRAPQPPALSEVEKQLEELEAKIKLKSKTLTDLAHNYSELASEADNLIACTNNPDQLDACKAAALQIATALDKLVAKGIPSVDDEREMLKKIDPQIGPHLQGCRDSDAGLIEAHQFVINKLKRSQSDLDTVSSGLKNVAKSGQTEDVFVVPADANTVTTVHVALVAGESFVEVLVVVHYQDWAWASMSAGVVVTGFKRSTYSVASHFDPAQDALKQNYSIIERQITSRQLNPFTFANFQSPWLMWRWGGHDIGPTASVGVGANVSTQAAEFAAGPGLRIGRMQFVMGVHLGAIGSADQWLHCEPKGGLFLKCSRGPSLRAPLEPRNYVPREVSRRSDSTLERPIAGCVRI